MTHSKSDVDGNHCGITKIGLVSLSPPYCLVPQCYEGVKEFKKISNFMFRSKCGSISLVSQVHNEHKAGLCCECNAFLTR